MQLNVNAVSSGHTDLYVFRHGETISNIFGVLSGGGDTKAYLTEEGQSQAVALGEKISQKGIGLEVIYSSDLLRATKTAEGVLNGLNCNSLP